MNEANSAKIPGVPRHQLMTSKIELTFLTYFWQIKYDILKSSLELVL